MPILVTITNKSNNNFTSPPWSQRREAEAIVKNVTVHPIKPVYVTLVFAWKSIAGILLLPQLQLLVCSIILVTVYQKCYFLFLALSVFSIITMTKVIK